MSYFLSTKTIKHAYNDLTNVEIKNPSVLFSFLILKGCKFNSLTLEPLENIPNLGVDLTKRLSWLFGPKEKHTEKSNFINPFSMTEWGTNPKESMEKWVRTRLKNNIIGGATTWRNVIREDLKAAQIKFTYDYLDEVKTLTEIHENKINLIALIVWSNRFTEFERKVTFGELSQEFLKTFNISEQEFSAFFHTNNNIELEFQEDPHDAKEIRALIGEPESQEEWINVQLVTEEQSIYARRFEMEKANTNHTSNEQIEKLLNRYYQVILSGPPGTSKSFISSALGEEFNSVTKIQFHPQYSYQQFVGGYIVEKSEVNYKKGILLNLIDDIKSKPEGEKHLLIIDEINRANLSQVFGEVIQCLDRGYTTQILVEGEMSDISLPKNLFILGTMNSSDRTIGSIDHALRRRFINVYCPPNPKVLLDLCIPEEGINVHDLLEKINDNLLKTHKNRELVIGHALFLDENVKKEDNKYHWDLESLELLFNFKVLPMVEEYCYGNFSQIKSVLGDELPSRLSGSDFENAIKEYTYK
ncbi:McrB family protein [Bacillus sp. FJAT-45350]|uniref:McrB family protein n=1 Tax=Bacillus sp. FJAT-45350 TaxID=2011014 RepID=UPI000BB7A8F3|nr:AAA family ATPase [Bacillus sp. FJAT-45350]